MIDSLGNKHVGGTRFYASRDMQKHVPPNEAATELHLRQSRFIVQAWQQKKQPSAPDVFGASNQLSAALKA